MDFLKDIELDDNVKAQIAEAVTLHTRKRKLRQALPA
jgi:Arc/MetJ family transcription regulator